MTTIAYLNGRFLPETEAAISASDGAFLHGAGLFETMRAENGCVFRVERHLDRLQRSAATLLRPMERSELPDEGVFRELLRQNEMLTARMRLTVTPGPMRSHAEGRATPFNVLISATKLAGYPPEQYDTGVAVIVCPFKQSPSDPLAGHKTTAYLPRLLGLRQARNAGCTEALWFTTDNYLAEGSISNVFIVTKGTLRTPPLETPVLPGIARATVLEIAAGAGIVTKEEPLNIDDLLDADEVILTNAVMQVMPVIKVEKHDVDAGRPGPIAQRLLEAYRALVKRECSQK
jgi:branched-chain amino acid aminotransferase